MPGGRARWGWFPLTDAAARRLVAEAPVGPGDLVVDLGAGEGALTAALVDLGARVIAVELHPGRATRLRERFRGDPVTVVPVAIEAFRLPGRPFHVVANPPFDQSSALVRRLLGGRVRSARLVLPVQVAQRWSVKRSDRCSYRRLPAGAFVRRAPVPTAVFRIDRRSRR